MICAKCNEPLENPLSVWMVAAILEVGEATVEVKCKNCGTVYGVTQRLLRQERRGNRRSP